MGWFRCKLFTDSLKLETQGTAPLTLIPRASSVQLTCLQSTVLKPLLSSELVPFTKYSQGD